MKLSVKSDYAARAVFGLCKRYQSKIPVRAEDLAAEQSIPRKYLVQILIELKSQNIVKSLRGKDGGYLLARPPEEITMKDILLCANGQILEVSALNDPRTPAVLKNFWSHLQSQMEENAAAADFQTLLKESEKQEEMYYI